MNSTLQPITSIILAGGESTRMGRDKGILGLDGKPMIQHGIEQALRLSDHIIVIANNKNYNQLGVPVFSDVYMAKGPLGGIHAGLTNSKTEWNWIIGCDMPAINAEICKYMLKHIGNHQAVVPIWKGNLQPLCALYNKNCVDYLEACINKGNLKMGGVLDTLNVKFINITEDLDFYSSFLFTNLNNQQDVEQFILNKHES